MLKPEEALVLHMRLGFSFSSRYRHHPPMLSTCAVASLSAVATAADKDAYMIFDVPSESGSQEKSSSLSSQPWFPLEVPEYM